MKTPLAVMQNYGTLLQTPNLSNEKRLEYAQGINDASRRISEMITNILKLNRLENQQIFPETKKYNLGEQLCECLLNFENVWENKNIEIETDIEEGVLIEADSELLSLVWNNLFSNAFKFTEKGGTVSLLQSSDDEFITVKIKDTGCGFNDDTKKHIFDKFYQGDTSHAEDGNGLGLALVQKIAERNGYLITVESEVSKGTEFIVKLKK
jgi:signal transduction histidine kinase